MYNITYVLKKYSTVRIFLIVALSLAMAVLVGSGLHPAGPSDQPDFVQAPARVQQPAGTNTTAAARSSLDNVSALDQALKNMGSLERDRNSTSADTSAGTATQAQETVAANSTGATLPIKTLADVNQAVNAASRNNSSSAPNK